MCSWNATFLWFHFANIWFIFINCLETLNSLYVHTFLRTHNHKYCPLQRDSFLPIYNLNHLINNFPNMLLDVEQFCLFSLSSFNAILTWYGPISLVTEIPFRPKLTLYWMSCIIAQGLSFQSIAPRKIFCFALMMHSAYLLVYKSIACR